MSADATTTKSTTRPATSPLAVITDPRISGTDLRRLPALRTITTANNA